MNYKLIIIVFLLAGSTVNKAQAQRDLVIQENHERGIYKIKTHERKNIVATAEKHLIKLWDSRSWKLLHTVSIEKKLNHDWTIINMNFSESHLIVTIVELQDDAHVDNYFGKKNPGTRTSIAINITSGQIELDDDANFILVGKGSTLVPVYQKGSQLLFGIAPNKISTALPEGNFKQVDNANRSWFIKPDIADDSLFITAAQYSPEQKLLICGYSEGTIELRDATTSEVIAIFRTDLKQITEMHFAGDSLLIVEGRNLDQHLLVIDVKQRRIRRTFTFNCEIINPPDFEHQVFSFAPLVFDEICNFGTAFHAQTGWLLLVTRFNRIHLVNLYTGAEAYFDCPFSAVYDVAFLNNGENFLVTGDYGENLHFAQSPILNFSLITKEYTKIPNVIFDYTEAIGFSETGDAIYTLNLSSYTKWSLGNMQRIQTNVVGKRQNNYTRFLRTGQQSFLEVSPAFKDLMLIHNLNRQDTDFVDLSFLIPKEETEEVVGLVPDRFVITNIFESSFVIYDLQTQRQVYRLQVDSEEDFMHSEDGKWLVSFERENARLKVVDTDNWKISFYLALDPEAAEYFILKQQFSFSKDLQQFAFFQDRISMPEEGELAYPTLRHIQVCTLYQMKNKWKISNSFPYEKPINILSFGYEGKTILTGTSEAPFIIQRWAIKDGEMTQQLKGHTKTIELIADHKNLVFSHAEDNSYRLWKKSTSEEILRIMNDFDGIQVSEVILNKENYYMAKAKGLDMIGYQIGEKGYPFEQLDLRQNRPDKVIAALPNVNPTLVKAYERAYLKRLEKMDFRPAMLKDNFQLPEIIVQRSPEDINTNSQTISFMVQAKNDKSFLDRINVWVNDVPAYGMKGINLRQNRSRKDQRQLSLTLSAGRNKIQISVLNQDGVESLKETFEVVYNAPDKKPDLHLITLGVAKYRDTTMNLVYVEKDLQDVAALFQEQQNLYDNVVVHALLDKQVSTKNLNQIKRALQMTKVDDRIIIYVAGHGLVDNQLDYYLATYDTDFRDPAVNAIPYSEIERLLDDIPARQKLLVLDACHSGEIDKKNIRLIEEQQKTEGLVKFRSFPGRKPAYRQLGLDNSFDLMKELFVDLRRGTGASVISSASGVEFALEGHKWKNGVFTYAFLKGLREKKAAVSQDDPIFVSELQTYLAKEVPALTNQHQRPSMRVENISNDWQIW